MSATKVSHEAVPIKTIDVGNGTSIRLVVSNDEALFIASRTICKQTGANLGSLHAALDAQGKPFIQAGKLRLYRRGDLIDAVTAPSAKPTKTAAKVDASNDDIARANGFAVGGSK